MSQQYIYEPRPIFSSHTPNLLAGSYYIDDGFQADPSMWMDPLEDAFVTNAGMIEGKNDDNITYLEDFSAETILMGSKKLDELEVLPQSYFWKWVNYDGQVQIPTQMSEDDFESPAYERFIEAAVGYDADNPYFLLVVDSFMDDGEDVDIWAEEADWNRMQTTELWWKLYDIWMENEGVDFLTTLAEENYDWALANAYELQQIGYEIPEPDDDDYYWSMRQAEGFEAETTECWDCGTTLVECVGCKRDRRRRAATGPKAYKGQPSPTRTCPECEDEGFDSDFGWFCSGECWDENTGAGEYSKLRAETFEAPYTGAGSLMGISGDTDLSSFTPDELTKSSAIHGDFDTASLDYSGHQNLEVRAEDAGLKWKEIWIVELANEDGMKDAEFFRSQADALEYSDWVLKQDTGMIPRDYLDYINDGQLLTLAEAKERFVNEYMWDPDDEDDEDGETPVLYDFPGQEGPGDPTEGYGDDEDEEDCDHGTTDMSGRCSWCGITEADQLNEREGGGWEDCPTCGVAIKIGGIGNEFCVRNCNEQKYRSEEGDYPEWDDDTSYDPQAAWESIWDNWHDEWMSGEANEDVVNQIAEAVVKNDPAGNLVIEDNYGWYLNLSNEQREDILGKPYLNEIIDENIDRIAESWDDQFMSEGSERFAAGNSNHWMTFGRVDYNWATDPDDIPLTDEEFWEIDEYIRNEIRYEIDTNNLPGESEVSSWTLSMTPDEGEEFIIYYYWGPAQTTGVNSAEDFIERHQEDPAGLLEAEGEEIYWNASCEPCYWENRFISTDKGQLPDRCPFCEKAVTMVAVDVENNLLAAEESVDFACPLCGAKDSLFPVLGHYGETAYECQQCRQLMGGGY